MKKPLFIGLAVVLVGAGVLWAGEPGWWRGVIKEGAAKADYAAANLGQLKNMAKAAFAELQASLPGWLVVDLWGGPGGTGNGNALAQRISQWSTSSWDAQDYAALNLGQLKAVAKPFYDLLISMHYTDRYPWTDSPNAPNDYAVANIGQLKNVFSFDVRRDEDNPPNGLPDWWERYWFGRTGLDPNEVTPLENMSASDRLLLQVWKAGMALPGETLILTIISGESQNVEPGSWSARPFVVKVTNASTVPRAFVPVYFEVTSGSGLLASTSNPANSEEPAISRRVYTDARGLAQIYVFCESTPSSSPSGNSGMFAPLALSVSSAGSSIINVSASLPNSPGTSVAGSLTPKVTDGGGSGSGGSGSGGNNGNGGSPTDSDGDGVTDDLDGWAKVPNFAPPRLPVPTYAVVPIGPADSIGCFLNNKNHVIYKVGDTYHFWTPTGDTTLANNITSITQFNDGDYYIGSANFSGGNAGEPVVEYLGANFVASPTSSPAKLKFYGDADTLSIDGTPLVGTITAACVLNNGTVLGRESGGSRVERPADKDEGGDPYWLSYSFFTSVAWNAGTPSLTSNMIGHGDIGRYGWTIHLSGATNLEDQYYYLIQVSEYCSGKVVSSFLGKNSLNQSLHLAGGKSNTYRQTNGKIVLGEQTERPEDWYEHDYSNSSYRYIDRVETNGTAKEPTQFLSPDGESIQKLDDTAAYVEAITSQNHMLSHKAQKTTWTKTPPYTSTTTEIPAMFWRNTGAGFNNAGDGDNITGFQKIVWDENTYGSFPPNNLNKQLRGVVGSGTALKLWQNCEYVTPNIPEANLYNDGTSSNPTSPWSSLTPTAINDQGLILTTATKRAGNKTYAALLVPVEVVELAPKLKDDDGNEISGSEKPILLSSTTANGMLKQEPMQDHRIAYREIKIKLPSFFQGKKVTWSMEPKYIPQGQTAPRFRGDWVSAEPAHRNRFEASETYGAHDFQAIDPATTNSITSNRKAETKVDAEGYAAIRVNVPPWGLNKARIKVEIEGASGSIELIDLEVPAVIVIDPGHGGTATEGNSSWNNAECPKPPQGSGKLEKEMTLEQGLGLRDRLKQIRTEQNLRLLVRMTRDTDINSGLAARANVARNLGADVFISLHFNGYDKTVRGTETIIRSTDNMNTADDTALANRVNAAAFGAVQAADSGASNRGVKSDALGVLSDNSLGNTSTFKLTRAALLETEFIDVLAVDQLLNTGPNAAQVKRNIINALSDAIWQDILIYNAQ